MVDRYEECHTRLDGGGECVRPLPCPDHPEPVPTRADALRAWLTRLWGRADLAAAALDDGEYRYCNGCGGRMEPHRWHVEGYDTSTGVPDTVEVTVRCTRARWWRRFMAPFLGSCFDRRRLLIRAIAELRVDGVGSAIRRAPTVTEGDRAAHPAPPGGEKEE